MDDMRTRIISFLIVASITLFITSNCSTGEDVSISDDNDKFSGRELSLDTFLPIGYSRQTLSATIQTVNTRYRRLALHKKFGLLIL